MIVHKTQLKTQLAQLFADRKCQFRAAVLAAVAAGAALPAAGGTLTVKFNSAMEVEVDGVVRSFARFATFAPTAVPCIYKMRPKLTGGERTFAIGSDETIRGSETLWRFPQYGDGNWVRVALNPYPSSDMTVTLTGYKTSNFYYVDAENGDDDWDGTTAAVPTQEAIDAGGTVHGPKKTLQAANDAASGDYPIVFAAPGVYDAGVVTNYSSGTSNPCVRRLVSTKNYIGFIATEGAERTFIVGAPDTSGTNGKYGPESVAGVYMSATASSATQFLQGFTITGCYSPGAQEGVNQYGTAFCSGAHRSYCLDCVISNNYAVSMGAASYYGVVERSRILDNESYQYTTRNGVFVSCVFAGNRILISESNASNRALHQKGNTYFCTYDLRNTKIPAGRKRVEDDDSSLRAALVYCLTEKSTTTTNATRWLSKSQAIDNPLFLDADARDYRLGFRSPARSVSSYADDMDGVARRLMASDVDGRMPVLHDGKLALGAVWNEPTVWYVAQDGGDDANDGLSQATAKATINAAIELTLPGDTVRVAPGAYGAEEGDRRTSDTATAGFRVIVPEDVTLESTDGAESTFIVGANAPEEDVDNATWRTGQNGVRCAYGRSGAVVRGFTLTGGRGEGVNSGSNAGAGFYSTVERAATVEDCVISNNAAYKFTIYQAVVKRCRVFGNAAIVDSKSGAAGYGCSWYGSIIDRNKGDGTVYNAVAIENCTIGEGNAKLTVANPQVLYMGGGSVAVNNSVVLGGRLYGEGKVYCTNSLIKPSWSIPADHQYNTKIGSAVQATVVSGTYAPVLGSFEGIDMAGAEWSQALGEKDLYRSPRVMNAAIDAGAVEYDWRPVFSEALGRRVTVTDVSPSVTTNASGGLAVSSGKIVGTLSEGGPYDFYFAVPCGTMEVLVGGVSKGVYPAGEWSVVLDVPDATTEFRLDYTPDPEAPGTAVVRHIKSNKGLFLLLM